MKKTILLGGSGFLGPQILRRYPEIISVGRTHPRVEDITHIDCKSVLELPKVLDKLDFENVIMMIGSSDHHKLNDNKVNPAIAIEKNVVTTYNVLSYFKERKINRLLTFTTILLYDKDKMQLPVVESQPLNPYINDYIFSKYLVEQISNRFQFDIPITTIRMTNIYGPTTVLGRPDVVNNLVEQLIFNKSAKVISKIPQRDFIYVKDATDAIIKLLDSNYNGPVNVATGKLHSIGDVVSILENISGIEIENQNGKMTGHLKYVSDISLLKTLTNWQPQYTLEQGLTETYNEMKAIYG